MKIALDKIPYIHVMRYMGNKKKLLPHIIESVYREAKPGSTVVDLMAGTHCIGYALKKDFRIVANDVQRYTLPIGRTLLSEEPLAVSCEESLEDLDRTYRSHLSHPEFRFFQDHYGDTYFSPEQCAQLDAIRYAIEQIEDEPKRSFYLTALIRAACNAQSTPGHFAQFLPKDHRRVQPLRAIDIWESFLEKASAMEVRGGLSQNLVTAKPWREFLRAERVKALAPDVSLVYIDPPYSQEQYSRFYHLLETLVLYDCPTIAFKAKYRDGRFMSNFSYRTRVEQEFSDILEAVRKAFACPVLLSYGSKGLLKKDQLLKIGGTHFGSVELTEIDYAHSTLGKGIVADNKEYLVIMR